MHTLLLHALICILFYYLVIPPPPPHWWCYLDTTSFWHFRSNTLLSQNCFATRSTLPAGPSFLRLQMEITSQTLQWFSCKNVQLLQNILGSHRTYAECWALYKNDGKESSRNGRRREPLFLHQGLGRKRGDGTLFLTRELHCQALPLPFDLQGFGLISYPRATWRWTCFLHHLGRG